MNVTVNNGIFMNFWFDVINLKQNANKDAEIKIFICYS